MTVRFISLMDDARIVNVRGRRLEDVEMKCFETHEGGTTETSDWWRGPERKRLVVYMRCFKCNESG